MELKPDVAAFSFFILWFLSLLCDSFLSISLPSPFSSVFLSLSLSLSSFCFFLYRSPSLPLDLSLSLFSLSLSLSPTLLFLFSLSVPFISCAECSPPSTVFLFSIHTISSRFSRQKHFLPNFLSNILSVTSMLNEGGNLLFRIWREPLFFASSVFVCALVYLSVIFSQMGCNQNTQTLKSRAQDHQGRDATLCA